MSSSLNLIKLLRDTVKKNGNRPALQYNGQIITYLQFWEISQRVAASLVSHHISPGDRVILLLPNVPEFVFAYYGVLMCGAIAVPVNPAFRSKEIQYIFEDSEAKAIIFSAELENEVEKVFDSETGLPLSVIVPSGKNSFWLSWEMFLEGGQTKWEFDRSRLQDPAVILYTSGTTGHPRGVMLSHKNLYTNTLVSVEAGMVTSQDVCLGILPFYHSFGQTVVMNTCVASGALNIPVPRFEPELVLSLVEKLGVTILAGVPTMFKLLEDYQKTPRRLNSVRICLSGAAKLDPAIYHDFLQKFGLHIFEGYGLTETSPVVSFNPIDYQNKVGSVGIPLSGIEVAIMGENGEALTPGNEGEIWVKGPNVMMGYWNKPEATKEVLKDGWLRTGDIGKIDEDGYIYILGRKNDLIIKGGFNVYPKEIEQIISYHPKVQEVAVIGVPDPVQGEEVKAFITAKPGKRLKKNEIISYCQEHMAFYKVPKYISFLKYLPKNSAGKVMKSRLRFKKRD